MGDGKAVGEALGDGLGEGEPSVGDGEAPVGDGEAAVGEGEAPVGDGDPLVGEGEPVVGDGEPVVGDGAAVPVAVGETLGVGVAGGSVGTGSLGPGVSRLRHSYAAREAPWKKRKPMTTTPASAMPPMISDR